MAKHVEFEENLHLLVEDTGAPSGANVTVDGLSIGTLKPGQRKRWRIGKPTVGDSYSLVIQFTDDAGGSTSVVFWTKDKPVELRAAQTGGRHEYVIKKQVS